MSEAPLEPAPPRRFPLRLAALAAVIVAVAAGALVLYATHGGGKESAAADPDCAPAKAKAAGLEAFAKGQIAALTIDRNPQKLTDVTFKGAGDKPLRLADFRGKTVLLNLWATWCIPCREEMPSLDRLQAKLGSGNFEVVAVSVDTARLDKRQPFLDSVGVKSLAFYADPSADILQSLKQTGKVFGLPTSFLVDAKGCELGSMAGPADWSSPDAAALIEAAAGK